MTIIVQSNIGAVYGGGFSPSSLSPALWLDPSDITKYFQSNAGTTQVTDTSVCGYATDISGNAFDVKSVADNTTRPTWNNNAGQPYLLFDGSNDFLYNATSLGMYNASGCSIFYAVRANISGSKTAADIVSEDSFNATLQNYRLTQSNGTTASTHVGNIRNDAGSTPLNAVTLQTGVYDNTDRVIGVTDSGSSVIGYNNGSPGTPQSYARGGTPALTATQFCLGGRGSASGGTVSPTGWQNFRLYGLVIVKRVLTTGGGSETAQLTTWLGNKMGLSL